MIPTSSGAELELAMIHMRDLQGKAERWRRADAVATSGGRDWGVSHRQALVTLVVGGLLALGVLRPWSAGEPAVAEAPPPAAIPSAGEPDRMAVPAAPVSVSGP